MQPENDLYKMLYRVGYAAQHRNQSNYQRR